MAVDEAAGILAMRGQPRRTVHALGRLDMVMDVAVAEMAEGQRADAGEGGGEAARILGNEARHQVHRDADIVLERRAVGALRLRNRIAPAPEGLATRLVLGTDHVADQRGFASRGKYAFERTVEARVPFTP